MTFAFRENSCILLGDTHDYRVTLNIVQRKPNIDNRDIVFIGDGGEGFYSNEVDTYALNRINEECAKRGIRFYCIRGNHSNPDVWSRGLEFSNVFLVPDYSIGIFPNGKKALLLGGGISIDRGYRKEGLDYWPNEITEYKLVSEKCDMLFSHDAPTYFNHSTASLWSSPFQSLLLDDADLADDCENQRVVLDKVVSDIGANLVISGHFHNSIQDEKNGIKYRSLSIEELYLLEL